MKDLYRIGEVSFLTNLPIKTLRFYEEKGLITPAKVDNFSGYRYYDDRNIQRLNKIALLRELGFSIKELQNFTDELLQKKIDEIDEKILRLRNDQVMLSYIVNRKGDLVMKKFINDKEAVGKWQYVCAAGNKEGYKKGDIEIEEHPIVPELYFLPNGEGYWIFERWTKGQILLSKGSVSSYEIEGDKLFLTFPTPKQDIVLVFKKVDSICRTKADIGYRDDVDIKFVCDKKTVGYYEVVDYIDIKDKANYSPKTCENVNSLYIKNMTFNPNGKVIFENNNGGYGDFNWSKGKVISLKNQVVMDYVLRKIDGETYMILDWKSGDYIYGGKVFGAYVLKKM